MWRFLQRCLWAGLPVIVTLGILIWALTALDSFLTGPQKILTGYLFNHEFTVPGLGLLVILVSSVLIGFFIQKVLATRALRAIERLFDHAPLIKMIYTSVRDLFNAFVGDHKHFDQPVLVEVVAQSPMRMVGFITNEDLHSLGLTDQVTVFLPMSYNMGGIMIVVPHSAVTPLKAKSGETMKFVVSAGLSNVSDPATAAHSVDRPATA